MKGKRENWKLFLPLSDGPEQKIVFHHFYVLEEEEEKKLIFLTYAIVSSKLFHILIAHRHFE